MPTDCEIRHGSRGSGANPRFRFCVSYQIHGRSDFGPRHDEQSHDLQKDHIYIIGKKPEATGRRLKIDVLALRQNYDIVDLKRIAWIPGPINTADPLTKPARSRISPLFSIMQTNDFTLALQGWERSHNRKALECQC